MMESLRGVHWGGMRLTRRELLAAGAATVAMPLAGCVKAVSGRPVLRVANWSGATEENDYQRQIREVYARFEDLHGCELQIEGIPGSQEYARKMLLNYVAGSQPDVMQLDASSSAAFIDNGIVRDLTPLIEKDREFSLGDFFPNVVEIASRGSRVYAVPVGFTPMVMYFNRQLFAAADAPLPHEGWTFQEFLTSAQAVKKTGGFGFKFISWMPSWIMWLWNNGGDVLSPDGSRAAGFLDSEKNVETIEFLRDLVFRYEVAPSLSQSAASGVDPFLNADAAMEVSGHWSIIGYQSAPKLDPEQIGVVSLPTNVGKSQTVMYESGLCIGRHCRHPELAWEYIKYMTSADVQRIYNSTGIEICARKDVAREHGQTPNEAKFLSIVPQARGPWGARVQGYDYLEAEGQGMMDNILKVGTEVRPALREMARRVDAFFAER